MLALKLALHTADYHPPTTTLDIIANGELWVGVVLIVLFTLLYGLRFRWFDTLAGSSIFGLLAVLSLLEIYSVITRLLTPGDYPLRDWLRAVVFLLLPAAVIFMFVALFISRERLRHELLIKRREPERDKDTQP
jgi:hypothetical protein